MNKELVLEQLTPAGPVEVGRLRDPYVVIGREPPEGVKVDHSAISRQHGIFNHYKNSWVYRDQGSTNGSWVNGLPALPNEPYLVRPGDTVQLADVVIRISLPPGAELGDLVKTALVFSRGEFLEEYTIPQFGKALIVGGDKADLRLGSEVGELPTLIIEGRGSTVSASCLNPRGSFEVHGKAFALNQLTSLSDKDVVKVGPYTIIISLPTAFSRESLSSGELSRALSGSARGSGSGTFPGTHGGASGEFSMRPKQPPPSSVFGTRGETLGGTVSIDPMDFSGGGQQASGFGTHEINAQPLEEKIILIVGIFLVVVIVTLLIWWLLV